jgi:predicted dehydrogenase/aryl-alcohol dehydrogenase-like predicted oxidoreductase
MSSKIRWGIIGTGAIAKCFANNIKPSRTGTLVAVGSRTNESAAKFVEAYPGVTAHGSYEALLADKNVDAVYVSTPHPMHAEWAIKSLRAGKHVMLEKPFTLNHAQAMAVIEEATLANKAVMEAFQWRCHPQTARLVELLKSKAIGDVQLIQSTFSFKSGFSPDSRLWKNDLAGGGIMDVGSYAVAAARLYAGAAIGKDFDTPNNVSGAANLAPTGVDAFATGTLKFPSGILATVTTGVGMNSENVVRIFGTEGSITVPNPWVCNRSQPDQGKIILKKGKETEEIDIACDVTSFTLEIDALGDAILAGKTQVAAPAMTWDDTLSQMNTLDQWRRACGVSYEIETDKKYPTVTVSGESLAVKPNAMKYVQIPGIGKKMSRLVMGCDNQQSLSHMAVMNDDFFEKGGNAFDTAYIYGGGTMERLLGQWMKLRGVRDQCVTIVKGCHTPEADPISLSRQLKMSLDRIQSDYTDIYMMHRDNTDIPVGEFVDVMNEHVKAGRIKVFGGSNWTLARVDEANEYARKNGLQGFGVVSNNFSLARMVNPVWNGCIAASDPESRAWFTKTQTALLSWSSQARGFFLPGRAAPDKLEDKELVRSWYSPDNFQRLERAKELAKKYNVSPINIALAYVLCQPFPTIALIGPRKLEETRTSLPGLTVNLTPDERKYLSLDV